MTQIKERPILFSGPMVRATLDDRKTKTRRVVKLPNDVECRNVRYYAPPSGRSQPGWAEPGVNYQAYDKSDPHHMIGNRIDPCPYGQPGDRLWVRETWRPSGDLELSECISAKDIMFYATEDEASKAIFKYRPSIHMPRWASRITLEIKDVDVERLQDISEEDARAEGIFKCGMESGKSLYAYDGLTAGELRDDFTSPINVFRHLWESINGPGSWDANPWVWAIEFERVKP